MGSQPTSTVNLQLLYYDEPETTRGEEITLHALRALKEPAQRSPVVLARGREIPTNTRARATQVRPAASTVSVHAQRLAETGIVYVSRRREGRFVGASPALLRVRAEARV